MVDNTITDEMIREKICQMFLESTKRSKKEYIGIEIEIPIINLNKEAVDFDIVHRVTESFKNHFNSFEVEGIDYDGNVFALRNRENDDIVCYDCSYNNIEFAMGKEEDLFTINERFEEYYSFIKEEFERYLDTFFVMYRKDEEFREKIKNSKGFCVSHFGDLCEMAEKKIPDKEKEAFFGDMFALMESNMDRLFEDVSWLIEKFDYRNKDADWKNSKDAVNRGMQKLKGGYPADPVYKMQK